MLVIKKRTLPENSYLYLGTAMVSFLSIAGFLAVVHLMPLLNVERFMVAKKPTTTVSHPATSDTTKQSNNDSGTPQSRQSNDTPDNSTPIASSYAAASSPHTAQQSLNPTPSATTTASVPAPSSNPTQSSPSSQPTVTVPNLLSIGL